MNIEKLVLIAFTAVTSGTTPPPALKLKANGMKDDSLAHAVVAIATPFGKSADYRSLTCISGNAWAPGIDKEENCIAHWAVEGRLLDKGLPGMAALLGLKLERVPLPEFSGQYSDDTACLDYRKKVAPLLAAELSAGKKLLVTGHWEVGNKHGWTHWAWAGVILGADAATGEITGAHPNGHTDNVMRYPDKVYAISDGEPAIPLAHAHVTMLRNARDRIRGEGRYKPTERDFFGLHAMDLYIQQMREAEGFCTVCHKSNKGWGDAATNAQRLQHSARNVQAYLKNQIDTFPEEARPALQSIAARYGKIDALLATVLTSKDAGYKQICGDLQLQKAHAEAVLLPIRNELDAIATDLDTALSAIDP